MTTAADKAYVLSRVLLLMSLVFCGLVLASFALFARNQLAGASKHQQTEIVAGVNSTDVATPVHNAKSQPGKFIDGAADHLTKPFDSIVTSNSAWVERGVPTILALLVYGVGLGFVARFSRGLT